MTCNFVMTGFVKKTLKKSHASLVERLKVKAQIAAAAEHNSRLAAKSHSSMRSGMTGQRTLTMPVSPPTPGTMDTAPSEVSPPFQSPRYDQSATPRVRNLSGGHAPRQSGSPAHSQNLPRQQQQPFFPPPPTQYHRHGSPSFPSPPKKLSSSTSPPQQPSPSLSHASFSSPFSANLHPPPLRLRSTSNTSTASTTSSSSTSSNPVCRDAQGRVTWSALKPSETIRYRPHPDYGHMNPYSEDSEGRRTGHVGLVFVDSPVLGFETPTASGRGTRATLTGPFVAELEG